MAISSLFSTAIVVLRLLMIHDACRLTSNSVPPLFFGIQTEIKNTFVFFFPLSSVLYYIM